MAKFKNIQFQVFHDMCMALGPVGKNKRGRIEWLFECFEDGPGCEGEFIAIPGRVKSGERKSCGCHMRDNIAGKIFYDSDGTPTCQALWYLGSDKYYQAEWLFRCLVNGPECKETFIALASNVKSGKTSSCGCLQRLKTIECSTTHGMSKSSEYRSWQKMHDRCYNPKNDGYKYYGGKGIEVDWEWHRDNPDGFANYLRDKGHIKDPGKNTSDRFDNNSNYGPKNDNGWKSQKEQNRNKVSSGVTLEEAKHIRDVYFNYNWSFKNIAEFFRCHIDTIRKIINNINWKPTEVLI